MYLALKTGGLSDIKLQQLILTLRNRTIHKCDLTNVCTSLEINIKHNTIRSDGETWTEHYPQNPFINYNDKYDLGLIQHHCFINDTTDVTSYCLNNYDEVKGLKHCNTFYNDKHHHNNRFIQAFQLFKILIDNVGDLIIPMPLTEEVMRTQFYDKVDTYETLEYTKHSYRQA